MLPALVDVRLADGSALPSGAAEVLLMNFGPSVPTEFHGTRRLKSLLSKHLGAAASDADLQAALAPLIEAGLIEHHEAWVRRYLDVGIEDLRIPRVVMNEPEEGEPYFTVTSSGLKAAMVCIGARSPATVQPPWLLGERRLQDQLLLAIGNGRELDGILVACCRSPDENVKLAIVKAVEERTVEPHDGRYRLTLDGEVRADKLRAELRELAFQHISAPTVAAALPAPEPESNEIIRRALWVVEDDHTRYEQGTAFAVSAASLPKHLAAAARTAGVDWALITCEHCLFPGLKAYRPASSSSQFSVEVLARDEILDLAVLAVRTAHPPTLPLDFNTAMQDGTSLRVAGLPNFGPGMKAPIYSGHVVGSRAWHGRELPMLDAMIVTGMSGGPALSTAGAAIGVVVTGALDQASAKIFEKHGAIPIDALNDLKPLPTAEKL